MKHVRCARSQWVVPRVIQTIKRRQNVRSSNVDNARRGIAPPPRAWSIQMGQCSAARTPPRAVRPSRWRDQEAARSNRRESLISVPVTSQWCAQDGGDQPARTAWPPRRHPSRGSIEGHHEGALHAACGRSRVPGVMTTTLLRVNAQELQVSTAVEENARNAPASLWQQGRIG